MRPVASAVFAGVLAWAASIEDLARAEEPASELPKGVQEIRPVERGFFVETDVGFTYLVNAIEGRRYGLGLATGIFAGYDLAPVFSLSIGGLAVAASGSEENPAPPGDLVFLIPMLQAQLAALTTERNFLWIRAGAGFAFGVPETVAGQTLGGKGPAFSATVHFEHYAVLRHFSIGAQLGALIVTAPGVGIGVSLVPTLKYTF